MNELIEAENTMFREMTGLHDWDYHDLPKLREDYYDLFVSIAGEENLKWITKAEYHELDGLYKRGQLMISPEGKERLSAYAKQM